MKRGRNPNRNEKKVLIRAKKDWTEWLFIESKVNATDKNLVDLKFRHKETNEEFNTTVNKF